MKNKTRNNKRKPLLVVALVLMVALVLGMGAMTYSRYISTDSMDPDKTTATVAKWGYVVTINADNMFGEEYNNNIVATTNENNDVRAVVEYDGNNKLIVAPGTGGSMTITVNGEADVLAQLSIDVANDYKDISLKEDEQPYNPIKWTLKKQIGNGAETEVVKDKTLAELVTELGKCTQVIKAGETINNITYTISWVWDIDGNDDADTVLGLAANEAKSEYTHNEKTYTEINTQLKLDLSVTIQQIQNSEINP